MCLLKSITYNDILTNSNYNKYYRCLISEDDDVHKYNVVELPSLLLCNDGKITKVIDAYHNLSKNLCILLKKGRQIYLPLLH